MAKSLSDFIQVSLIDRNGMSYFSYMLLKMKRIENEFISTIAVLPKSTYIELHYNPEFLNKLSYKEFVYIMKHEILHITNLHHIREIKKYTHEYNNICMDLAINSILGKENMPNGGIIPGKGMFKNIPINLSYEKYTELLKDKFKDWKGKGGSNKGNEDSQSNQNNNSNDSDENNSPIDNYEGHDLRRKESESMSQEEKSVSEENVKRLIEEASNYAKMKGDLPGNIEEIIKEILSKQINWNKYLKNWISEKVFMSTEPSRYYRNKRYPKLHGIVPGNKKQYKDPIAIAIDTSGSISSKELSIFIGEINNISFPKVILQCDTKVNSVKEVSQKKLKELEIVGRGGTSFVPIFDYVKKNKIKSVIVFTDMEGDFPKETPKCNVLWVSTLKGKTAPFGKIIELNV